MGAWHRCVYAVMAIALAGVGATCAGLYTHDWQHERIVHVDGRVVQQREAPDPRVGLSTVCWSRIEVPGPGFYAGPQPSGGPVMYLVDSTSPAPCNPERLGTHVPMCHSRGRPQDAVVEGLPGEEHACASKARVIAGMVVGWVMLAWGALFGLATCGYCCLDEGPAEGRARLRSHEPVAAHAEPDADAGVGASCVIGLSPRPFQRAPDAESPATPVAATFKAWA